VSLALFKSELLARLPSTRWQQGIKIPYHTSRSVTMLSKRLINNEIERH
jgi:hypothetical protein